MSRIDDDTADNTPPHGYRLTSSHAEVRPGEVAPPHDHGGLPADDETAELDAALARARNLFGSFRNDTQAFNDPEYRHLAPKLRQLHERLKQRVRVELEDDELLELMLEVRHYLLRRDA